MSGLIGHTLYAVIGARAASERRLPIVPIAMRHWSTYLAGAYLACDIQTMPEAVCVDTGQEVGYGTVPLDKSPITGGDVRPWSLECQGVRYRPSQIHDQFYGRSHLVFGWAGAEREHTVPWDHLADYFALFVEDTIHLYGPGERPLAYLFGWMVHIVGDCLIKSIRDGLALDLLGGRYNSKNRPIQDLVSFHEIGIKELGLNWPAMLTDLAETPVEKMQFHGMRVSEPSGELGLHFPNAWAPEKAPLLAAVLQENRRYLRVYLVSILKDLELHRVGDHWECSASLKAASGGLSYEQMIDAAEKAHFRNAMWQIGESIAGLFQEVVERVELLRNMPRGEQLSWDELTKRWRLPITSR